MIKEHVVEQVKPMKRLEQMRLDEELSFKLQAEEEEEERLLREQKKRGTDHQQELNKGISSIKRVNAFVDYRTELVKESSKKAEIELEENLKKAEAEVIEGSSKRAGEELEQESIKK
ncbi:hypothetical protein Tco_0062277 [Tanacetum coccineum]